MFDRSEIDRNFKNVFNIIIINIHMILYDNNVFYYIFHVMSKIKFIALWTWSMFYDFMVITQINITRINIIEL